MSRPDTEVKRRSKGGQIDKLETFFRPARTSSKKVLETKVDVNRFETSPMESDTANPRTGPVPI